MRFSHRFLTGAVVLSILGTLCFHPITAEARRMTAAEQAAAEAAEAERQAVYNKAVDSNSIEGWPQGPQIYAESAIVMEADTGTILYNKDMDMVNYPASITKIMTRGRQQHHRNHRRRRADCGRIPLRPDARIG